MSNFKTGLSTIIILLFVFTCNIIPVFAQTSTSTDSIEQSINHVKPDKIDTNTIKQLNKLAYQYTFRDTSKALKYLHKSAKWSKKLGYKKGLAGSYRIMGILRRITNNYQSSMIYFDKSLKIVKDMHFKRGIGIVYMDLGILYRSLGDQSKALSNELKALDYFTQLDDSLHIVSAYTNIGTLYNIQGKNEKAINYFLKAAQYFKRKHNRKILSIVYENLGVSYQDLKKYPKALMYYKKSLDIERKIGNEHIIAYNNQNIGDIYVIEKKYKKALTYFFKAQKVNLKLGEKGVISNTYTSIGQDYLDQRDYSKAMKYADLALKYSKASNTLEYMEYAENLKSQIYARLHEYKKAYNYQDKYYTFKDSLEKKKEHKKFTELAQQYESKQKEEKINLLQKEDALQKARLKKEALYQKSLIIVALLLLIIILLLANEYRIKRKSEQALRNKNKELESANGRILKNERIVEKQSEELKSKNVELTKINEQLKALDESKNDFFRVAAHDMKNPLLGISSITDLMLSTDYESNPSSTKLLNKQLSMIHSASSNMISLISRLLTINQIDTNSFKVNLINYPIWDIIDEMVQDQQNSASQKNIKIIHNESKPPIHALIDKEAFRQVMDNLISNAIKYSEKNSSIRIEGEKEQDIIQIRVIDEGPGLSEEDQMKLFQKFTRLTPRPTNGENSSGLGLYIVKKYVDAMNGKIWCESQQGKGSTFVVELPLADD